MMSLRRSLTSSSVAASCGVCAGNTWIRARSGAIGTACGGGDLGDAVGRCDLRRRTPASRAWSVAASPATVDDDRPADAGPEALGEQVVGAAGGLALGQVAGVAEAQPDREQRDREQDQEAGGSRSSPATGGAG